MIEIIKDIRYETNGIIKKGIYKGEIVGNIAYVFANNKWYDIELNECIKKATQK